MSRKWTKGLTFGLLLGLLTTVAFSRVVAEGPYQEKQILNVVYKTVEDRELKLNLFLPTDNGRPLENCPTLIWIDSGCWYSNEPGDGAFWRAFHGIENGYAVVSVSHRSLDYCHFPCQIEDVRAAVRFLRAHADEYGLDPNRFASMGASSGGNLSLCLGIPDKSPFDVGENLDQSSQVQVVVDFFGPADFLHYIDHFPPSSPDCVFTVLGKTPNDVSEPVRELATFYSPITYVNENFAPTIIFHGVVDTIVPLSQSAVIYDALLKAGVRTTLITTNEGFHNVESLGDLEVTKTRIFDFMKEAGF